jgi:hypothetical protein
MNAATKSLARRFFCFWGVDEKTYIRRVESIEPKSRLLRRSTMHSNIPEESQTEIVPNASCLNHSTALSSADDAADRTPKRSIEVDFCELENGTLVEMIQNPHDATKSALAICENGQIRYVEKLECGDQVLVPVPRDAEIIRHVCLATAAESFDSVKILLADIMVVVAATLELPKEHEILLASFVLSTWFAHRSIFGVCRSSWVRKDGGFACSESVMSQELADRRHQFGRIL